MHYDALIIGAGLSGLAAGIRLAHFEKRVCILERHTTVGGLNSFYRLRGRNYDVGLHAVTNYAPPGTRTGPLSKLLRQLRLGWDDFALCPQVESRVDFPGCRLRFSNDPALLDAQVAARFPAQADRFRRLVEFIDAQDLAAPAGPYPTARAALAAHLSDPLLIDMLLCPLLFYGSPTPRDMEFLQFVIMFRSIFREGFGRPYAGVRRIMKAVTRRYKALGGELRLRSGVRAIRAERGRAMGVTLDDGRELSAEHILSSAGAAETSRLCAPAAGGPADASSVTNASDAAGLTGPGLAAWSSRDHFCASDAPGDITFVETIATLDRQPADLGHRETIIFFSDTPELHYANPEAPCDLRSGIICSPNNFQYDRPLPEGAVRVTALANRDYWMTLPPDDYAAAKRLWHDRIAAGAVRHVPDFRAAAVDVDTFTPRTIRRFTGHLHGCVYGAPGKRWDGRTHLENLYLCGTDQGYLGIVGSMISGISMANLHILRQ